jgi:type 1 glutamine amidotransferase
MRRAVVLTGGPDYAHDFSSTGPELAAIAHEIGFSTLVVQHPDDLVDVLSASLRESGSSETERVDVLIVNALRWRMLADQHAQWREAWSYTSSADTRQVISEFVSGGGGLVGNHTAPICFDDWDEWGDVLGGAWNWGESAHPPRGPVSAQLTNAHPITEGVASPLALDDEVYGNLRMRPNVQVLATAKRTSDDDDQPMVWTHTYGVGRVAYCCFGHDIQSLRHVGVRKILHQAIMWTAPSLPEQNLATKV